MLQNMAKKLDRLTAHCAWQTPKTEYKLTFPFPFLPTTLVVHVEQSVKCVCVYTITLEQNDLLVHLDIISNSHITGQNNVHFFGYGCSRVTEKLKVNLEKPVTVWCRVGKCRHSNDDVPVSLWRGGGGMHSTTHCCSTWLVSCVWSSLY